MPARARTIDIAAVVDGLRAELGTGERAAWMIDPGAACLYALNAKATSLYPQASKGDTGVTVDSAMPAIVTLRRLMRTPKRHRSQDRPQWLLFWTNRGQKRVLCDIRIVATDSGSFCLARAVHDIEAEFPAPADGDDGSAVVKPQTAPRDDAETLREIARQIRAGTSSSQQKQDSAEKHHDPEPPQHPVPRQGTKRPRQAATPPTPKRRHDRTSAITPSEDTPRSDARQQMAELSHELRTPLSAILTAAEILKDERLGVLENFRYRGYARDIYQSAANALALIDRVFQDARNAAPEVDPPVLQDQERIDLTDLTAYAVRAVAHVADAKSIDLEFDRGGTSETVEADRLKAAQILINLLANAVKFTPEGGVITVAVRSHPDNEVAVEIEDSGPGIEQEEIKRLLSPQAALRLTRRHGGGLGLGLALSRKLADEIGARLALVSEPGAGTTASLIFDRA